jgi:hypothetical protein
MELAGLEPATSWVRSRFGRARPFHCSSSHLTNHRVSRDFQPFVPSRLHSASRPVALHLCQKRVTSSCLTCLTSQLSSEREAIVNVCHAEVGGPTPGFEPGTRSLRVMERCPPRSVPVNPGRFRARFRGLERTRGDWKGQPHGRPGTAEMLAAETTRGLNKASFEAARYRVRKIQVAAKNAAAAFPFCS